MVQYDYPIEMEIAGSTALFSRPDCGDSPVSYPAPTYSAVKAMFESVLWGPAVEIVPQKVELCAPLQWHSYKTNYGGPLRSDKQFKGGDNYQLYATVLIDVCYRLFAIARPGRNKEQYPQKARDWDKKTTSPGHAYQVMFERRLRRGQSYASLCLGWREFTPSYFGPFRESTRVCEELPDIEIPSMLRQVFPDGFHSTYRAVYDTNLVIHRGTLLFPERRELRE
ncbi:MAG: CRISPR-associated protein Cas5 [bacterium]